MATAEQVTLSPITPKVREEFQVIAGYIVGIFVNERYNRAQEIWKSNKKINSVTEGYYMAIGEYIQLLQSDSKFYIKTLEGIIGYYHKWTDQKTLTIMTGIDQILQNFIPPKFFYDLRESDREATTQQIIKDVISRFAQLVLSKYTGIIIDKRKTANNNDTVYILRDEVGKILQMERDEMWCRFAMGQEKIRVDDHVSTDRVKLAKMKELAQKFLDQRKEIEVKLEKAVEFIKKLTVQNQGLKKQLLAVSATIKSRDAEIDELNIKLEETYERAAKSDPPEDDEIDDADNAEDFDPNSLFATADNPPAKPSAKPPAKPPANNRPVDNQRDKDILLPKTNIPELKPSLNFNLDDLMMT